MLKYYRAIVILKDGERVRGARYNCNEKTIKSFMKFAAKNPAAIHVNFYNKPGGDFSHQTKIK